MVEQHVGRSRRVHAERGADDAAARLGRLDDVGLEVLVEVLRDAHRPEADRLVHAILAHLPELAADVQQFADVLGPERGRVGRRAQQKVADEPTLAHRIGPVRLVHVGVVPGKPRHLPIGDFGVLVRTEIITVFHELHGAAERGYLQSVPVQLEGLENLGP